MSKLYAFITSQNTKADKEELLAIARQFSYSIETFDDGVLFNVSGLGKLIGNADRIAQKILTRLKKHSISGNVAVAATVDTAILLARQNKGLDHIAAPLAQFQKLPLESLDIEKNSVGIFHDLGITNVEDLLQIPVDDLIDRYGPQFRKVIDVIQQKGRSLLTPNVKESNVAWKYELDFPVEDFEQLIFIINHGLDDIFADVAARSLSTEHLDIAFKLSNKTTRSYEIKTSFPTLEKTFWLKLINLRVSMDPPEAAILSVNVVSHFTKPRHDQKGLYAVSRPAPESLLLTAGKLKKLVGEENVGVPILLNQRLAEPFTLDTDKLPEVRDEKSSSGISRIAVRRTAASPEGSKFSSAAMPPPHGIIAFSWYRPPLRAEVLVRDGRLVFIRTRHFSGYVTEYSGVWRQSSKWWDKLWKTQEWDIEVEDHGVYRLCKASNEWFLTGEYD